MVVSSRCTATGLADGVHPLPLSLCARGLLCRTCGATHRGLLGIACAACTVVLCAFTDALRHA
eukprot:5093138-Alexandrium_andersonii.AAC.1